MSSGLWNPGLPYASGRAAVMPQAVLVKLVFGYDHPERILARAGLRPRRAERQLICTLFPRRQPYFRALDRF